MAVFRDTNQLYEVLDTLFVRLSEQDEIAAALLAGRFVLRFRYREPDGEATIDLRGDRLEWSFGGAANGKGTNGKRTNGAPPSPDLELIQSGDVAHKFWLGQLNVPLAIASRKVVARGQIAKALALLPAVKPAFPIYREVLEELGLDALAAPAARGRGAATSDSLIDRTVARARELWRAAKLDQLVASLSRVKRGAPAAIDAAALNAHYIPLVEGLAPAEPQRYRASTVPADEIQLKVEMLRRMQLIRHFELQLSQLYADGRVPTEAIHLSIGQEATAVGACFALRPDDYVATTHRGHGHMLAKGAPLEGMMAEIMGRATGLCGGKGGSMHVTDAAIAAIGANGIVGASPLIAAGAAHTIKRRGSDQVAVAFFGDGATNQGMFHEAMNFAAVFELPAVFVLENNYYGEFTALAEHTRVAALADRAVAYNMPAATVDGNDVWAVYEAMGAAVARARRGGGPTLLVCDTYRWHGHMEGESVSYRPAQEIADWKARCPIAAWRGALERDALASADAAGEADASAQQQVAAALAFALDSDEPGAEQVTVDVFAPEPAALYRAPSGGRARAGGTNAGREISCAEAIRDALAEEMRRDDDVYLLGEDVSGGGYFAVTAGLVDELGRERVIDTPISEYAIVGSAVGAAMTGSRPVAEILFSDFLTTCMDPIVNNAAKLRYMSGGQYRVPMVVRTPGGAGLGMAAQHSQSLEGLLTGVPGLIVMAPSTAADAKGLLKAAIRSNNPVLFFENKMAYATTGVVPDGEHLVPIGVADVKRVGRDATLVPIGAALITVEEAARALADEGIDVEIVDPRTLVPLDLAAIVRSVHKTGRLITVEEAPFTHGFGAEIVARVTEHAFDAMRAAPRRVAALDVPIPYNSALERRAIPDAARIERAVRSALGR